MIRLYAKVVGVTVILIGVVGLVLGAALEGRGLAFVVNGLISLSDVPADFPLYAGLADASVTDYFRGGSGVVAPDGTWVVPSVVAHERHVIADLNLRRVVEEPQKFDPTVHHSRRDVFIVHVDRRRSRAAEFGD